MTQAKIHKGKCMQHIQLANRNIITQCVSEAAAQCIATSPVCWFVCVCVCVCLWVCYHDNSKLCASILTKLGLLVKVVTISSWLNFGRPTCPGRGSAVGWKLHWIKKIINTL